MWPKLTKKLTIKNKILKKRKQSSLCQRPLFPNIMAKKKAFSNFILSSSLLQITYDNTVLK